jgi:hypothetical protein
MQTRAGSAVRDCRTAAMANLLAGALSGDLLAALSGNGSAALHDDPALLRCNPAGLPTIDPNSDLLAGRRLQSRVGARGVVHFSPFCDELAIP